MKIPHPHIPHLTLTQIRVLRLFSLVFVFSVLVLYAVFRSARFQELLRQKSELELTRLIGRPVTIGGFDLALVPFSFTVKNVAVANDPRGLPGPCFAAAEVSLRGFPHVDRQHIRLEKIRLYSPRIVFELFEDGTSNFSAILEHLPKGEGGGADVAIGEALIQRGTFRFRELGSRIDVLLKDAALVTHSEEDGHTTRASFACRRAGFRLEDNQPLDLALGMDVVLTPRRLHASAIRLRSDRLSIDASGGIEDLKHPVVKLDATALTTGDALAELFGLGLPIKGRIAASGAIRISGEEGFRIRARFELPRGSAFGPFPMAGYGSIRVDPGGLLAHVERAETLGGSIEAFVRVARLKQPPLPVRIQVIGRDLDFERFFAELGLQGTGLMARADLDTTLTFGPGGIERADGAGTLLLRPSGEPSAVAGRHALPLSGGGPLLVRDGKLLFTEMPLNTAQGVNLTLGGSLALGTWEPAFAITLAADDLAQVERLAENLYPAIQKEPLKPALKMAGRGTAELTFTRAFGDPRVEGRLVASDFVLRNVRFGETSIDFLVDRNVLTLNPLHAEDEGATLTVAGKLGWGGALRDQYRMEGFTIDVARWPLKRILDFLAFDLPLEGKVTGRLPLDGVTPRLTGAAPLVFEEASIWGQPVDRLEGTLAFESDKLRLTDAVASLGEGSARGGGSYRFADGAYDVDLSVEKVPLAALASVKDGAASLTGVLTATVKGQGNLEKPGFAIEGSIQEPRWDGHPLGPENRAATFRASAVEGVWSSDVDMLGAGSLKLESLAEDPPRYRLALDVQTLVPYAELLGQPPEARLAGQLTATAEIQTPAGKTMAVSGALTAGFVELFGERLSLAEEARFTVQDGVLRIERLALTQLDTTRSALAAATEPARAVITGTVGLSEEHPVDLSLTGAVDTALLRTVLPDAEMEGRFNLNTHVTGTAEKPELFGRVSFTGLSFVPSAGGPRFDAIDGVLELSPGRVLVRELSMAYGGGTIGVGGLLALDGGRLSGIRLNAHAARVRAQPIPGFKATFSGDLVLLGDSDLRTVRGDLVLDRGLYDADINIGIEALLARGRVGALGPEPTRFDAVDLNLRIDVPQSAIEIRNNVARMLANGELVLRGTWGHPILLGQIEAEEGGRLSLRDVRYEVQYARILFSNPQRIDPYFELSARATIKDYEVLISLSGTASRVVPRFSSDPPLSEAQIVSLLATGELPSTASGGVPIGGAPVSTDQSISQAARELLAGLATGAVTARGKEFFRLDRFQIDPVFVGSSIESARVTVGKQIASDLTVTYSYTASQEEQVILVEYQLRRNAFLQFLRDENGVYSVDLKLRQSFR